jgi:hypothetical protein
MIDVEAISGNQAHKKKQEYTYHLKCRFHLPNLSAGIQFPFFFWLQQNSKLFPDGDYNKYEGKNL